jgi:CAAX prenyl protease-like protein
MNGASMRSSRNALLRIAPFGVFMLLLGLRAAAPADGSWGFDPRWLYAVALLVAGGLLAAFRREYGELARQNWPPRRELALAAAVGIGASLAWTQLDAPWMTLGDASARYAPAGESGRIDALLVAAHWLGAVLVVPPMEELFWRSFLLRWFAQRRFELVDPRHVGPKAIVLATFVFVIAHTMWLAAAIAGLAYAWLYVRSGTLWSPVVAHAVTNAALGLWVVSTGQWQFW